MTSLTSNLFDKVPVYNGFGDVWEWAEAYRRAIQTPGVTEALALGLMGAKLQEVALIWWETAQYQYFTWRDALKGLETRFRNETMEEQLRYEFERRGQGKTEDLEAWFLYLQRGFRRFSPKATDEEQVSKFVTGLQPEIRGIMLGLENRLPNMQSAFAMAKKKLYAELQRGRRLVGATVAMIDESEGSPSILMVNAGTAERAATQATQAQPVPASHGPRTDAAPNAPERSYQNPRTVPQRRVATSETVCFQCNERGHYARDCPKGAKVCEYCWKAGHEKSGCVGYLNSMQRKERLGKRQTTGSAEQASN